MIGIYEVRHLPSGRAYIGGSVDTYRRMRAHRGMLRRGAHFNRPLQDAWDEHGEDAFAFNELAPHAVLGLRDREAAEILARNGLVYNISDVVQPGCRGQNSALTDAQVLSLRAKAAAGASTKAMASEFGVPHWTASRVVRGDTYLHLTHGIPCRSGLRARGERCARSKLTREDVLRIRERLASGDTGRAIAAEFGITQGNVSAIRCNRTWKHL